VNVLLVLVDSLNRADLPAYGGTDLQTPNIDRLARRAWRFDGHYVGSLPCMPKRRELFAGFKELMWRPWGALEPFDARLPRIVEAAGYR
jgi:arylsulfatase A-like enzyme